MTKADILNTCHAKMALPEATEKIAQFRQSCWTEVATGISHIYYDGALPPQDGTYTKTWDQHVFQITICTPYVGT